MLIGHLPAGYITSKLLCARLNARGASIRPFILAGMLGAVAPDFDMLYFYFADHRRHLHHTYWPHYPVVWISLLLVSAIWYYAAPVKGRAALAVIFALNGFIHMLLDSIVGKILWFAPYSDTPYALFTVAARYKPWWLNFVFHWTFALELALVAGAIYLWRSGSGKLDRD